MEGPGPTVGDESSPDGSTEPRILTKHWKFKEDRLIKKVLSLQGQLEEAKKELRSHHFDGFNAVATKK